MKQVYCQNCGNQINDTDSTCPHCNYLRTNVPGPNTVTAEPIFNSVPKKKKGCLKPFLIVFGSIFAVSLFASLFAPETTSNDNEEDVIQEVEAQDTVEVEEDVKEAVPVEKLDPSVEKLIDSLDISIDEAKEIYAVMQSVGFSEISNITIDEVANNEEFTLLDLIADDFSVKLMLQNKSPLWISAGKISLYNKEEGGVLENIQDYVIDNEFTFIDYSKIYVEQVLKSPSSAKYPGSILERDKWQLGRYKNVISVSSYVDSQNSFGAMIRSNFFIQMDYDTGDLLYMIFDDEEIFGSIQPYDKETYEQTMIDQ